jgi:hypothetical protein
VCAYAEANMQKLKEDSHFADTILNDNDKKWHNVNFYLPHELGGAGQPYLLKNLYGMFNTFNPIQDLAQIKPIETTK